MRGEQVAQLGIAARGVGEDRVDGAGVVDFVDGLGERFVVHAEHHAVGAQRPHVDLVRQRGEGVQLVRALVQHRARGSGDLQLVDPALDGLRQVRGDGDHPASWPGCGRGAGARRAGEVPTMG